MQIKHIKSNRFKIMFKI